MSINILCQLLLFLRLRLTMKTNLNYFYEQKKCHLYMLFVSNAAYHGSTLLLMNLFSSFLSNYLHNYFVYNDVSAGDFAAISVLNILQVSSFITYAYCCTNCIDFDLYLKVVLYNNKMFNKFDNISYMITKSCWAKDDLYVGIDTVDESSSQETMAILKAHS